MKKYILVVLSMLISVSLLFHLQQTIEAKKPLPAAPQIEFYQVSQQFVEVPAFSDLTITLSCNEGDQILGAGYFLSTLNMRVLMNQPDKAPSGRQCGPPAGLAGGLFH